ncbi:MAG: class I SAM-dependent methyltransferase [Minisyncoccia bacterium]
MTLGNAPEERSYKKISPTAWGVAWRRTLTDIPYSKEIFEQLKQAHSVNQDDLSRIMQSKDITPMFEARYKLVNKLLERTGSKQILELAAGFAPRGLELTRDPEMQYAELDLSNIIHEKRQIIENILEKESRTNLHFIKGSALCESDVMRAVSIFRAGREVTVINEGLLRYLSHEEKAVVASNVLAILKEHDGVWITPDIPVASILERITGQSKEMRERSSAVEKMTGINRDKNYFRNKIEAQVFFEERGFTVEQHSFMEAVDELVSPKTLSISPESVSALIGELVVFLMKARR